MTSHHFHTDFSWACELFNKLADSEWCYRWNGLIIAFLSHFYSDSIQIFVHNHLRDSQQSSKINLERWLYARGMDKSGISERYVKMQYELWSWANTREGGYTCSSSTLMDDRVDYWTKIWAHRVSSNDHLPCDALLIRYVIFRHFADEALCLIWWILVSVMSIIAP